MSHYFNPVAHQYSEYILGGCALEHQAVCLAAALTSNLRISPKLLAFSRRFEDNSAGNGSPVQEPS
jgi:hypothetical protein